jgi:DNA polymerase I-like protein with 3'-5' exonuclease and polymerase domains
MTARGIPVDTETYARLQDGYQRVLQGYRHDVDPDGQRLTPKGRVSQRWLPQKLQAIGALATHPRTPSGRPSTKARALAETAERYDDADLQRVAQWAELLATFPERKEGGLRLSPLGRDGRIRYHQFAFATHTGRSLGLGKEALMQLPAWMRGLIQPRAGEVVLAADYAAQEVAVAAGLSEDQHLRTAYEAGDPYRQIALLSGVWNDETSEGQARRIRRLFKSLVLGKLYGMALPTFRRRSGVPHAQAARVWQFFDRRFSRCLDWQARTVAQAQKRGWIRTRYGWKALVYSSTRTTALLNWLIQSTAADILRLATILMAEAGFMSLTTVHDSVLVSVPEGEEEARGAALVEIMQEASTVAVGIPMRVDLQIIRPGERLLTADTWPMWERVMGLLEQG